ncbi:MAG: SAM-dependent methyltransferase [Bdellovibrionota bacterium]
MLNIVATPLGNPYDITVRALEILKICPIIICESTKEASTILKFHDITGKKFELLNEHTEPEDVERLMNICKTQEAVLVSDCGTPGFHDPGYNLIKLCRKNGIEIKSLPGPSSIALLISLLSERMGTFYFVGFLPQETEKRQREWQRIAKIKEAIVLMDTPYRLKKMLTEMSEHLGQRKILIGCDLTLPTEAVIEGPANEVVKKVPAEKAEFMIWIYPT